MRKRALVSSLGLWFFAAWLSGIAGAGDAEVLPKGVFKVDVESKLYLPTTKRFNPAGALEDIAIDFNTSLNSSVFPGLRQLESTLGLPAGFAKIGDSIVAFRLEFIDLLMSLQYGVTDRFTVGVLVPYYWQKSVVSARLDTSRATVGKNAVLNTLAPLRIPGTQPLTTEDVQALLGKGLDINGDGTVDLPGFGFKRFETWSGAAFGDLETGFRYQYLKTKNWRLALTSGVRFPTGQVDDPDNLVDVEFGTGAYALLFRANNDFTGIANLVLHTTLGYDLYLPDRQTKRVPDNVNQPITTNKEEVKRDLGDIFKVEVSGRYTLLQGLSISGLYEFGAKRKDQVSGKKGFAYASLEEETHWTSHIFIVGLSYTTVPLYLEKRFPLSLVTSITYRDRFAGSNNILNTKFISLQLQAFF
jgi:hypothetical protein